MEAGEKLVALITGASRGLGADIALGLAKDGFDIWLNYQSSDTAAEEVAAQIRALGRECRLLRFNVTDKPAVEAALDPLLQTEVPYILVNNAGFTRDGIFGLMPKDDWSAVLSVHLDGFFNVTRTVIPFMQRKRRGRIINMASLSGQGGNAGQVNYSAAKAGLIGATKALAREVGRRNILVNAVAPGFIETDMTAQLPLDKLLPLVPLGRAGKPAEVTGCVRFLCSEAASYITGQVIGINGGLYI